MEEQEVKFELTKKNVEEAVVQEIYIQAAFKTCICVLILNTGAECVGSYSPAVVTESDPLDINEGKKKAKKAAFKLATAALSSVLEWRKAVYDSDQARKKAMEEQQANQASQAPSAELVKE